MTELLIDAGNTRVKWAILRDDAWLAEGALTHADLAQLAHVGESFSPARVLGTNVAGERISQLIESALGRRPEWMLPRRECCGITNRYDDPAQLGADRWAALIGAHAVHRGPCLVVSAGTATTIDLLTATGDFEGGLILPGEELMRRSLARDTAGLPLAAGEPAEAPRNTNDAIVTGCLFAQAGAIERMFQRIDGQDRACCLLAGGAAARIAPLLAVPHRRVDHLVLRGLARIASQCE
jgi:type III pantothenate kinase